MQRKNFTLKHTLNKVADKKFGSNTNL